MSHQPVSVNIVPSSQPLGYPDIGTSIAILGVEPMISRPCFSLDWCRYWVVGIEGGRGIAVGGELVLWGKGTNNQRFQTERRPCPYKAGPSPFSVDCLLAVDAQ
jgi:hypothetical protein